MKTKFKDFLLYFLACIGAVSLFLSIQTQTQSANGSNGQHKHTISTQPNSSVPESHIWEIYGAEGNWAWLLNKQTGEVQGLDAGKKAKVIVPTRTQK
tara:strand:- start:290 stop:580 length:291 start_codon:yes stop_codon:yes gene_type:complete